MVRADISLTHLAAAPVPEEEVFLDIRKSQGTADSHEKRLEAVLDSPRREFGALEHLPIQSSFIRQWRCPGCDISPV